MENDIEANEENLNTLRKLEKRQKKSIKLKKALLEEIKFELDPKYRYLKHKSRAKYMFKIPKKEYMVYRFGNRVKNYDEIQRILTNRPHIDVPSDITEQRMKEKCNKSTYYYGQVNDNGKANGYGLGIFFTGEVQEGLFVNGKLDTSEPYIMILKNLEYRHVPAKNTDMIRSGYCYREYDRGNYLEGYVKGNQLKNEKFTYKQGNAEFYQ